METSIEYEKILESAQTPILALNPRGALVYANGSAFRLLGLKKGEEAAAIFQQVVPELSTAVLECISIKRSRAERLLQLGDIAFTAGISLIGDPESPEGAVCCLSIPKIPVREQESSKVPYVELNAIFESSSDGIWVCDGTGKVIRINDASEKLNGIRAENTVGRHVSEIMAAGLFDRSVTLEVLATGRQVSIIQNIRETGKTLLVTGTPVFDEAGKISIVVVNERDITQLNIVREQLEQTRMVTEKYRDELAGLSVLELQKQEIIAESQGMRKALTATLKLAQLDASNVLILGESGTGKGLLAKFIHKNGKRSKKPFIQINCAALPESLLEAELFGYEKGAFTGARADGKAGLFELAQEGTLFLDEIGNLPLALQAKLLKYLDDHEVMRLGSLKTIKVDCAVLAATNQDPEKFIKEGRFRRDLLYRLNTFTIRIPPLRDRCEDIFELTNYFLGKYNRSFNKRKKIAPLAMDLLQSHSFPGNVRELKSIIKRAVCLTESDVLDESILEISGVGMERLESRREVSALPLRVHQAEKEEIELGVSRCRTTRELAQYLGVSQPTAVRKLKKHGFGRLDSKSNRKKT